MALPANGTAWPPVELAAILPKYREYASWYSNDVSTLTDIYTRATGRQGVISRLRTWFLGAKSNGQVETNSIHVSLAQEICRTSANLLYSEPAKATVVPPIEGEDVGKVQERLDLIAGPDFEQLSISSAEISAALGGVFKRITWDSSIKDHVFITKVDADSALPEFTWGQLTAVTFWRVVGRDNATVWRLLERHELRDGIGVIVYGLYQGTDVNLGQAHGFDAHEATAWLLRPDTIGQLIDGNTLSTLTPGLGAVYAPNILPSSLWRNDPLGSNLGRSDLEGIEQKLDALDELYSAWLRDIRLGKGRLIVGESMLRDLGAGLGAGFDLDTTIFTPVKAAPSSAGSEKLALEQVQFNIRTDDFLKAIDHFRRIILAAAGYSPSTFGLTDDGAAMTATEVAARQQLSFTTRKRKVLGVKPADEAILAKALAVDAAIFPAGGAKPYAVSVEFPDGIGDDAKAIAETNQLDYNSQSSSIESRVRTKNPDWDDIKVDEEVARIKDEFGLAPLEDPAVFGTDGAGIEPQPAPTFTG
ncbi:MAG: phage portal protein [Chloroflexota bacterium]|nr:phage portal protein [Chloroflexota bacterium]